MADVLGICNVWTPGRGYCGHEVRGTDESARALMDEHALLEHLRPPLHSPWRGLAVFSPDRVYRYALGRQLSPGALRLGEELGMRRRGRLLVVCLNPSTADETKDDPTVARLSRWARAREYDELVVANIFALRATDPKVMRAHEEPVGELNDRWIEGLARDADAVVAAWGAHGEHLGRGARVFRLLRGSRFRPREVFCFALTKDGHPRHPLYLRKDVELRSLERVPGTP